MRLYILIGFSILLLVVAVNYIVDPAGLNANNNDKEKIIGDILIAGKNVGIPRSKINFEERRLLAYVAQNMKRKPETITFGSSRFRYIYQEMIEKGVYYNHSINAATLEDFYLLYSYYKRRNRLPKKIILGLDPWMIEKDVSYIRLMNLATPEDYVRASIEFELEATSNAKKIFAPSFSNFQLNNQFIISAQKDDLLIKKDSPADKNYIEMVRIKSKTPGKAYITFDAKISTGTYNFSFLISRQNGKVIVDGGYLGPLKQGQRQSVHAFRRFQTPVFSIEKNEEIIISMMSSDGDMKPVNGNNQKLQLKNIWLYSSLNIEGCSFQNFVQSFKEKNCRTFWMNEFNPKNNLVIKELFSVTYFQESVKHIYKNFSIKILWQSLISEIEDEKVTSSDTCEVIGIYVYFWCSDGTMSKPHNRNSNTEVLNIVKNIDDGIVGLKVIDEQQVSNLKKFLSMAEDDGVKLAFVLMPIHPHTFDKWQANEDQKGFSKAETLFRALAKETNTPIFGTYNPHKAGFKSSCFRDWVHPYPECVHKIVENIDGIISAP